MTAVPEIGVDDLAELFESAAEGASGAAEVVLIDVREPDEYEEAHVPGALLMPLATVPDHVDEIPTGGPVYLICQTGARSKRAGEFLRAQGRDAVNVAGGTSAWVRAGHPYDEGSPGSML